MTVAELIAYLEQLPPTLPVVTDLHSEYKAIKVPQRISLLEKGGWWSRPYSDQEQARSRDVCYIEARYWDWDDKK